MMEGLIAQRANAQLVSNFKSTQQLESNLVSPASLDMANWSGATMLAHLAIQGACRPATVSAFHAFQVASSPFLSARLAMRAPVAHMLLQEQEPVRQQLSAV